MKKLLIIGMSSSYGHSSNIETSYKNPKESRDAMMNLVSLIHSCN